MLSPALLGSEGLTLMTTRELFLLGITPFLFPLHGSEHPTRRIRGPIFSLDPHQVPAGSETAHLQEQVEQEETGPAPPGPAQCNTYGAHGQHSQLTLLRKSDTGEAGQHQS